MIEDLNADHAAQMSKEEELPARLAPIVHECRLAADECIEPDLINEETMRRAILLTEWFKSESFYVRAKLQGESSSESNTAKNQLKKMLDKIQENGGEISIREAQRKFQFNDAQETESALNDLVQQNHGHWESRKNQKGGPASRIFVIGESEQPSEE